jgi:hypothetical protein
VIGFAGEEESTNILLPWMQANKNSQREQSLILQSAHAHVESAWS